MKRLSPLPLLLLLAPATAAGHFAPSPTQNNRYAKLTLLPGSVRISYTVYFGDKPGQIERMRMDRDGDGLLGDGEIRAFGEMILAEVGPQIVVEVDGARTGAPWTLSDVGVGTPTTQGGAFAVDLAMIAPLPDPAATTHGLYLEDRWPAPSPGENEVNVDESPGVRVVEAHVRRDGRGAQLRFAFTGGTERPEERGIVVKFVVDPELARAAAAATPAGATATAAGPDAGPFGSIAPARRLRSRTPFYIMIGVTFVLMAVGLFVLVRKLSRPGPGPAPGPGSGPTAT